jgi:HK97 family phage major capsid protein
MRTKIRELRQKRAKAIADARAILDTAEKEERELTDEEQQQYDKFFGEAEQLRGRIERMERQLEAESDLEQPAGQEPVHTRQQPVSLETLNAMIGQAQQNGSAAGLDARAATLLDAQVINPILHRYFEIAEQDQEAAQRQLRAQRTFARFLPRWIAGDFRTGLSGEEWRALQADLDVSGGFLRPPEQFMNNLIKFIDDMVFIRQWATTFTVTNAESMGVPTLETDPADADWTSELATGSEDTTMSFGKRELHPHPLAKRIKISRKLIRAVPNSDMLVRDRLGYKFAITYEKACLTGNGAGQPLGVFTASSSGISTSRDVSTGNTDTELRFDGLIEAKYSLKAAYWPMARWLFHRDAVKQIAKLKDGEGQYLWRESVRVGEPDRVLGLPSFMSEYAPNTFTTGLYAGILGDFSNYWIADALTLEFQLLNELYAETNQVGLIGRLESDGQPVLEEAFARVKLA